MRVLVGIDGDVAQRLFELHALHMGLLQDADNPAAGEVAAKAEGRDGIAQGLREGIEVVAEE